jgi:hypothetical protein
MFFFILKKTSIMKRIYLMLPMCIVSAILFAQEKSTDVNINVNKDGGGSFWGSPWLWVVGAAVFILLLVAVSRGRSRG